MARKRAPQKRSEFEVIRLDAVGPNVKRFRVAIRLSRNKLAARAGISVSTLFYLEEGVSKDPTLLTVFRIATVLGVPISELFREMDTVDVRPERKAA